MVNITLPIVITIIFPNATGTDLKKASADPIKLVQSVPAPTSTHAGWMMVFGHETLCHGIPVLYLNTVVSYVPTIQMHVPT